MDRLARLFHRHDRRLEGMRSLYPTDTSDVNARRVFAPFISDVVFPVTILPDLLSEHIIVTPAAGSDWFIDVPSGQTWTIKAISMVLVTDANVASRAVSLQFVHPAGVHVLFEAVNPVTIPASVTRRISAGPSLDIASSLGAVLLISLPSDFRIPQTTRVQSVTSNIQAGDQYSELLILIDRVPDPAVAG